MFIYLLIVIYYLLSFGWKISDDKQNFGAVYPRLKVFLVKHRNLLLRQWLNRKLDLNRLNRHLVHNIKRIIRVVFSFRATHFLDSNRRAALGEISDQSLRRIAVRVKVGVGERS
jgi:hypothetical protein